MPQTTKLKRGRGRPAAQSPNFTASPATLSYNIIRLAQLKRTRDDAKYNLDTMRAKQRDLDLEPAKRTPVFITIIIGMAIDGIPVPKAAYVAGPQGLRFTLTEPWSALLLDDERVIHESTPIQPLGEHGWRDTLVLTFRQGGFQGP